MNNKIVDARGKDCPIPLIMTRKAIKKNVNSSFLLLIDNEIAKENVERFLTDNNVEFKLQQDGNTYRFSVNNYGHNFLIEKNDIFDPDTQINKNNNYVVCIKSSTMGNGSEELGEILMKAFINTLIDSEELPSHIIFYNSGAQLVITDSGVVESLKQLSKSGIKIIVCGACVDYFGIKEKLEIGIISNMFDIISILSKADKVIYP